MSFQWAEANCWLQRFAVNVFGMLQCCQVFGQLMAKQGSGTIINVGSVGGLASVPWMGLCT